MLPVVAPETDSLASLRHDLSKLRAKPGFSLLPSAPPGVHARPSLTGPCE